MDIEFNEIPVSSIPEQSLPVSDSSILIQYNTSNIHPLSDQNFMYIPAQIPQLSYSLSYLDIKYLLNKWCRICKISTYFYIIIILIYQIYWIITTIQHIEKYDKLFSYQYMLIIQAFLLLLALLGAYFCLQAVKYRDSELAFYAMEYMIMITTVLCIVIIFVTYKKIKFHKWVLRNSKGKILRVLCGKNYENNQDCYWEKIHNGDFQRYDEKDDNDDNDDMDDFIEEYRLDVKIHIFEGVIIGSLVFLVQCYMIFVTSRVYKYAKDINDFRMNTQSIEMRDFNSRYN
ncbi:hypothetical protein SteCoe_30336 [Stentor coeruleus]|uniref:Transmembrane protein n=1 Tax=Stentor coeruleus TaxID=5963 RepID=A0A1R2B3T2_9CILI|nr:hypothetical protein SteCoe_30336 [Stentor coeruleus]